MPISPQASLSKTTSAFPFLREDQQEKIPINPQEPTYIIILQLRTVE
ncbi:MAG: hypothetical protein AB8G15_14350 [Saprospiraceae bacterium]